MDKQITIDGKEVKFRATARTPRLYRLWIGRDMIQDMNNLAKNFAKVQKENEDDESLLSIADLTIFENASWVMAKHADPQIENSPDEWLDTFGMFDIYKVLPEVLQLWNLNNQTTSHPKKK